jgi:transmembrane sensor
MKKHQNPMNIDGLILKLIQGTASAEEYQNALHWINQNSDNFSYYEQLRDTWIASGLTQKVPEQQIFDSWNRVQSKISANNALPENPKGTKQIWRLARIAAVLIVTFLLGFLASGRFSLLDKIGNNPDFFVVEAPLGAKSIVTLTDGTKVWLNAGSKLRYGKNFNQQNRDVYLQGEAFFNVAKSKKLPFFVHSAGMTVEAVGTAFNVKAYPEEGYTETTLVEGIVSIEKTGNNGGKERIMLYPNQKASISYGTNHKTYFKKEPEKNNIPAPPALLNQNIEVNKHIETELYTSWKDDRWVFKKENIKDFAIKLERLYDVEIIFRDKELMQYNLSGTIEKETLEQVLNAIKLTIPLEYSINHRQVILTLNKQLNNSYIKLLKHN